MKAISELAFIKIDGVIFNPSHICSIEWSEVDGESCCRVLMSGGKEFELQGENSERLIDFIGSPDCSIDLMPSEIVERFQEYQMKGGDLAYEDWRFKYKRHLNLVSIEVPTDRQNQIMSQLEHELLY